MKIAEQVRKLRKKHGVTLEALSTRAQISVRTLTRIESDKYAPQLPTLLALVRELGETFYLDAGKGWLVRLTPVHHKSSRNKSEE